MRGKWVCFFGLECFKIHDSLRLPGKDAKDCFGALRASRNDDDFDFFNRPQGVVTPAPI
jgi:hypothetical protein